MPPWEEIYTMFKDVFNTLITQLSTVVAILAIAIATAILVTILRFTMRRKIKYRLPEHIYKIIENIVTYTIVFVAALAILSYLGIDLSGLLIASGFAGLVIGIASQQAVSNLVSGLFLMLERPLSVGDYANVANIDGVVQDISIISTKIRTWDGPVVRIPNSKVFESIITNYRKSKVRRIELTIGISYESDVARALDVVSKMIEQHPYCLVNPAPQVFVDSYGDSAIILKIRCWAPTEVWFATRIELLNTIKQVLSEAGIEIPYPQRVVHIKTYSEKSR